METTKLLKNMEVKIEYLAKDVGRLKKMLSNDGRSSEELEDGKEDI